MATCSLPPWYVPEHRQVSSHVETPSSLKFRQSKSSWKADQAVSSQPDLFTLPQHEDSIRLSGKIRCGTSNACMCVPQRRRETWSARTVSLLNIKWIFTILSCVIKILLPASKLLCITCSCLKARSCSRPVSWKARSMVLTDSSSFALNKSNLNLSFG